jgi:hypothetical protein
LTALISIAFMMRNTSPVGWIPLLAIKVLRDGALPPFIISAITVALPILFMCVYIDTEFYGSDKWVFTGYNFLEMNILHGLSKYFGTDPWHMYLVKGFPGMFVMATPLVFYSGFSHARIQWSKH